MSSNKPEKMVRFTKKTEMELVLEPNKTAAVWDHLTCASWFVAFVAVVATKHGNPTNLHLHLNIACLPDSPQSHQTYFVYFIKKYKWGNSNGAHSQTV